MRRRPRSGNERGRATSAIAVTATRITMQPRIWSLKYSGGSVPKTKRSDHQKSAKRGAGDQGPRKIHAAGDEVTQDFGHRTVEIGLERLVFRKRRSAAPEGSPERLACFCGPVEDTGRPPALRRSNRARARPSRRPGRCTACTSAPMSGGWMMMKLTLTMPSGMIRRPNSSTIHGMVRQRRRSPMAPARISSA